MMTEYEAQKLKESMYQELNVGSRVVWQCAAGLLIFFGLAVVGTLFNLHPDSASDAAQFQERRQASVSRDDVKGQGQAYAATQSSAKAMQDLVPAADAGAQDIR